MIKKTTLFLLLVGSQLFADNIYNTFPTDKEAFAFKKGFSLSIMSLIDGREFRLQGRTEEEVKFKDFLVMVDTTDLDDADKFAIQKIGFIYADSIRLTDERIVIADFERKANAVTLARTLNTNYFNKNAPHRRAYIYEKKTAEKFYREKSFFYEIANLIEENLKTNMKVIYIKDKQPITKNVTPQVAPQIKKEIAKEAVNQEPTIEKPKKVSPPKENKPEEKPLKSVVESKINTEPFFIQFLPKGRYINRFKLSKDMSDKTISNSDLIKQSQIENPGELLTSENYLITTDGIKYFKSNDNFYYLSADSEIIADFVKEQ